MESRLFLRDEELDRGAALILASARHLLAVSDQARQAGGLNTSELALLLAMHSQPGATVSALREALFMTVPTFARLLGGLEQRHLVRKEKSRIDGRQRRLFLSEEGKALLEPCLQALRAQLRAAYLTAGPEQVAGIRRTLETLIGADNG